MFRSEYKSALHEPLIPLEEKKVTVDINDTEETFDNLDEAIKKLSLCIALLDNQIRKHRAANCAHYSVSVGMLGAAGIPLIALLNAINTFNAAFSEYQVTMQPHPWGYRDQPTQPCGQIYSLYGPNNTFPNAGDYFYTWINTDTCPEDVQLSYNFSIPNCAMALQKICDGPGMWFNYVPTVIIGIVLPSTICLGILAKKLWNTCQNKSMEIRLTDLPHQKSETIKKYLIEYKIVFSPDAALKDLKNLFTQKLTSAKKQKRTIEKAIFILDVLLLPKLADITASYLDSKWESANRTNLFAIKNPTENHASPWFKAATMILKKEIKDNPEASNELINLQNHINEFHLLSETTRDDVANLVTQFNWTITKINQNKTPDESLLRCIHLLGMLKTDLETRLQQYTTEDNHSYSLVA